VNLSDVFSDLISNKALTEIYKKEKLTQISGLCGSSFSFVISNFFKSNKGTIILVLSDKEKSAYLFNELQSILGISQIHYFPESARTPYQSEEVSNASVQERAELLNIIGKKIKDRIIVTTTSAICEKVVAKTLLEKNTLELKSGEKLSVDFLMEFLESRLCLRARAFFNQRRDC
jgi:transcription-repair coupling factor (superfamily II helicase)